VRYLGRLLPEHARLADDPYGAAFALPSSAFASLLFRGTSLRSAASLIGKLVERADGRLARLAQLPGMRSWILYMQVRTRAIDDAVRAFAAAGGRQVVLLGAGYDCRSMRVPELAGALVVEIDHPATQRHKREVLARLGARSPATYIPWDFESLAMEDLPDALAGVGLARERTFTIWEGVTMYLSDGAIDASLRAIRAWSPPGSQLALTYFTRSLLAKPSLSARAISALVSTGGEPFRFGWDPGELAPYLAQRGFTAILDRALSEAACELLPAGLARHVSDPNRRFAIAVAAAGDRD
jgi:methyltransferase (TIGR00027 family)